jgi:hypothetical protein
MKKIIIGAIAVMLFNAANAQLLIMGPRAGLSSSKIKIDFNDNNGNIIKTGDALTGYHVGIFTRIQVPLIGLYVQPEFLYTRSGGNVIIDGITPSNVIDAKYELSKFDIPVMVGVKMAKVFRINAGPTFSFMGSAKQIIDGVSEDVKDQFSKSTVAFQAGIGFDLGPLIIDLKYENSLSKLAKEINFFGTPVSTDNRNPQYILSLGFKL